jgi:hypothetical protein
MSKHMQLTTKIKPYYKKGLAGVYPRFAHRLRLLDPDWLETEPSLFEIVKHLDRLLYKSEADPPFRAILRQHKDKLHDLYERIEEQIADWHLAEADKRLYDIEDVFDDIEKELGKTQFG